MYISISVGSFISLIVGVLIAIYLYRLLEKDVSQKVSRKPQNPEYPLPPSHSPLHEFPRAGVCTDNDVCGLMARKALEDGGSVVDAALSALLCNGLIGMQSMGLGGGMLMKIYIHEERKSYSICAREISPMSLRAENFSIFRDEQEFKQSSWSIAVPTELAGYALAHQRFGRLPWAELVKPTLGLCHTGYRLYKHQYDALALNRDMIKGDQLLRKMFIDPKSDDFWPIGHYIQPPGQLCDTYERLAMDGPYSFYNGSLAEDLLADLSDMGSAISKEDLNRADAKISEALVLPLDEYDLHLTPLPGSGHVLGLIMSILRHFRRDFARTNDMGPLEVHRMIEAMKFGFVKRWQLDEAADEQLLRTMTSSKLSATMAEEIDDSMTFNSPRSYGAPAEIRVREEHGTAHTSVLHDNDAVSVTSTINFYFGSGRTGKRTGVLFNNAMSDFSIKQLRNYFDLPFVPGKNRVTPSARPMSSMSPLIVTERSTGQVRLVVGAAGGTKIISSLVPLLVRILWQQANIKYAIDASRIHHQMLPNVLLYEYGLLDGYVKSLETRGHVCERYLNRGSVICGITQKNGTILVNSDYRKPGGVTGF
ncbi:glutathione hydrolase 1 proenzyme isoform X2 [Drosophila obscura]|uniref:glutathione hydrolase 1 proenzyme isoform X2 n=1 Tax=Drosophila obscura TaxID=7282 RepID=UPI001BB10E97|nr:glutathione hydrolase 1 proenzyme isoform X2 [Drosophila obscura]